MRELRRWVPSGSWFKRSCWRRGAVVFGRKMEAAGVVLRLARRVPSRPGKSKGKGKALYQPPAKNVEPSGTSAELTADGHVSRGPYIFLLKPPTAHNKSHCTKAKRR